MSQRISQCWMSRSLKHSVFWDFAVRWKLKTYEDRDAPLIVYGCYREADLRAVNQHRGLLIMLWGGSDILVHGSNSVFRKPNIRHLAISKFIARDLRRLKKPFKRLNLPGADMSGYEPAPLGDSVYAYMPKGGEAKYGGATVEVVRKRMPKTNFIVNRRCEKLRPEMKELYTRSFIGLRLSPHDGVANTVVELGLMGRRCVYNGDTPNAINWKTAEDVIAAIKRERARGPVTQAEVAKQVYEYLHWDDGWLDSSWWE